MAIRDLKFNQDYVDERAKEAAKLLSSITNISGKQALFDLANLVTQDHRTLQQSFMREFIWPLLKLWAEKYNKGQYDERNYDTVKTSFDVITAFADRGFRFI